MPMTSLKPLYDVPVTGFWPAEAEMVLTRPSPSGKYVQLGMLAPMLGVSFSSRPCGAQYVAAML